MVNKMVPGVYGYDYKPFRIQSFLKKTLPGYERSKLHSYIARFKAIQSIARNQTTIFKAGFHERTIHVTAEGANVTDCTFIGPITINGIDRGVSKKKRGSNGGNTRGALLYSETNRYVKRPVSKQKPFIADVWRELWGRNNAPR